ncbi:hypothetical protein [Microbispora bryophytorum]|uniref:hypothetical protein n=1 Tax=Microbispora bryophytorum TaxID=1460882 RepID=UPI0033F04374
MATIRELATARQIGYLPNESARTLATKKSFMVGLVWDTDHRRPGWRHPFFQEILIGLKTALSGRGYHLLMLATSGDTSGERTEDAYVRAVRRHNLDGVIMIDLTGGGEAGRPAARAAWWRSCPRG